jgi:carbonic anhydrase/acetyltransferase-like protein (isoleucine patch superfamily)
LNELDRQLDTFLSQEPTLGEGVFVADGAVVLGDVTIGHHSSIWFHAVLRGDINRIAVGHHTNIQDNAVLHVADNFPCVIGDLCTVGHGAIVHACEIGNEVLIGMGATVLDGAVIGDQSLIGANCLVRQGMRVPPGSLVMGVPGRIVRELTPSERRSLKSNAEKYAQATQYYLRRRAKRRG